MVFGSSKCPPGSAHYRSAEAVGSVIGRLGLTLVSGGYDGSMGAASAGAAKAGGKVVGITTAIFTDRVANQHLSEHHEEPNYPTRMSRMLREGDGFVALPGGLGTLSEWLTAWCLSTIDQLGGPLWLFEDPWRRVFDCVSDLPEVADPTGDLLHWVRDAAELEQSMRSWVETG